MRISKLERNTLESIEQEVNQLTTILTERIGTEKLLTYLLNMVSPNELRDVLEQVADMYDIEYCEMFEVK